MNIFLNRAKLKIFAILSVSFIFLILSAASAAELSGIVFNSQGKTIENVTVKTDFDGTVTVTGKNGNFSFLLKEGMTRVTFSSVGYKPKQFEISQLPAKIILEDMYYRGTDIVVHASRAETGVTPIAFDNFSADDIKRDYTVSEFPLLLETTPNVLVYSDGGASLGYTYLRIRGFDDRRIVTYINGVPLNDPEDQVTYFIDLPDFTANVSDIQVQRGVGNSLYGDASFGGSINVVTSGLNSQRSALFTTGMGRYTSNNNSVGSTYKQSFQFNSGLVDGRYAFGGRFSKQKSDGYRRQSWYDGWSYYFNVVRIDPKMTTEINIFGGPMKVHAAWYGASKEDIAFDRRANVGIPGYEDLTYDNATDNFNQPHYQLHNTYLLNDRMTLSNTFYYIRGKGYYEQYKPEQYLLDYNITDAVTDGSSLANLVRQKWVEKKQIGWNPRLDIKHDKGQHSLGGSFYYFDSDHYGKVVWSQHLVGLLSPQHKYYNHFGTKYVGSLYFQEQLRLNEKLSVMATGQLRFQKYSFEQEAIGPYRGYTFDIDWFFFSPRIGFTYNANDNLMLFTNVSLSQRTPSDAAIYDADDPHPGTVPFLELNDSTILSGSLYLYDFGEPLIKSEKLLDFELGGKYHTENYAAGINLFWMNFKDMIVGEGGVTDGVEDKLNVNKVVHAGIELTGAYKPFDDFRLSGNFSYNFNRIKDFVHILSYEIDSLGDGTYMLQELVGVDVKGNTTPRFPEYLGNLIFDYDNHNIRLTWRNRFLGKQYSELINIDQLAIDPVYVSSFSASYNFGEIADIGKLTVSFNIDNLFDKKYESAVAYAENYAYRVANQPVVTDGWSTYFVAPERSFYGQIQLELF